MKLCTFCELLFHFVVGLNLLHGHINMFDVCCLPLQQLTTDQVMKLIDPFCVLVTSAHK